MSGTYPHLYSVISVSIVGRKQCDSGRLVNGCLVVMVVLIHLAVTRGDAILLPVIDADLHAVGIALDPALHLVSVSLRLTVFPALHSHRGDEHKYNRRFTHNSYL